MGKVKTELTVICYIKGVYKLPNLSFMQKSQLIRLILYGKKKYPSYKTLAKELDSSYHSVFRALHGTKEKEKSKAKAGLIELGYVSIIPKSESKYPSNEYIVHYSKILENSLTESDTPRNNSLTEKQSQFNIPLTGVCHSVNKSLTECDTIRIIKEDEKNILKEQKNILNFSETHSEENISETKSENISNNNLRKTNDSVLSKPSGNPYTASIEQRATNKRGLALLKEQLSKVASN